MLRSRVETQLWRPGWPRSLHGGSHSIRVGQTEAVVAGSGMQTLIKAGIELKVADSEIGGLDQTNRGFQFGRAKLGKVDLPTELQG